MAKLSIIVPCYFNEENVPVTGKVLIANEKRFPKDTEFEYIFVDDGSQDQTHPQLVKLYTRYPQKVTIVKLSRNFGANNASLAGMSVATGDCCCILAADLQEPPELIPAMYAYWRKGVKLVVANRKDRQDRSLSLLFSHLYHNLMRRFVLPNAPPGGFDLCLFDRQLKDDILAMREKNFFLPYLLIWLGYDYVTLPYVRRKREVGISRWTFSKRIKSFIDSFISFTYFPLRLITACGLLLSFIAVIYAVLILYNRLTSRVSVEGWTLTVIILLFVSSFQMIALGIIGEYLWRTLDASRCRPPYIIEKITGGPKVRDVLPKVQN